MDPSRKAAQGSLNDRTDGWAGLGLTVLAFLATIPALIAPELVSGLAMRWELAIGPSPFFLPDEALQLYVLAPAVTLSAFVLFLLPGVLLVRALRDPGDAMALTVLGFGTSLLLLIVLGTTTKLVTGVPLDRNVFIAEWITVALLAALAGVFLRREPPYTAHEAGPPPVARRVVWLFAIAWAGMAALAPKVHWENLSVDGIEALEFGRSLTNHVLPYWDVHSGSFGFYRNFVLFAWPDHFFINLFGPVEAAVRLPIMLFFAVLFAVLVLLIEHQRRRRLGAKEEMALALAIGLFAVVQAFNTNYEPFFADLAETAATDTIWVICFLAAVWALWTERIAWFWIFGLMNYASSPGGMFLLLALSVAVLSLADEDRSEKLPAVLGLVIACVLITAAYELLYVRFVLQGASDQFSSVNMVRRLLPPTLTEWSRLNTLVFATGVVPALTLFAARRRDGLAWCMAVVTVIYFGVVYVQVWASVHQFTPAMVMPLVVFWRLYLNATSRLRTALLPLNMTLVVFCVVLSLPRHDRINVAARQVGAATDYRIADYETAYLDAARGSHAVYWLFPEDYRLEYPEQPWGTDRYAWLYYATLPKPEGTAIAYVIQDPTLSAPAGGTLAGSDSVAAAWVVDQEIWQQHREPEVPRVVTSPLYEPILRSMFRFFREYSQRVEVERAAANDPG